MIHTYDGAGHFGHVDEPIELLITPVTPDKIHLAGDWNLLHLVRGPKRHRGRTGFDRMNRSAGCVPWLVSGPRKKPTITLSAKPSLCTAA